MKRFEVIDNTGITSTGGFEILDTAAGPRTLAVGLYEIAARAIAAKLNELDFVMRKKQERIERLEQELGRKGEYIAALEERIAAMGGVYFNAMANLREAQPTVKVEIKDVGRLSDAAHALRCVDVDPAQLARLREESDMPRFACLQALAEARGDYEEARHLLWLKQRGC